MKNQVKLQGFRYGIACSCRNCRKQYREASSRADYKGYCSQACMKEKARNLGYKKPTAKYKWQPEAATEYGILKKHKLIGSVCAECFSAINDSKCSNPECETNTP